MVEWPCCHDPLSFRLGIDDLLPPRNNPSSHSPAPVSFRLSALRKPLLAAASLASPRLTRADGDRRSGICVYLITYILRGSSFILQHPHDLVDFFLPFAHCFCSSWPLCFFLCLTWWILSPSLSIDSMISPTERHLRFHSPFLVPYVSWILLCEFSLESLHNSQKWGLSPV